MSRVLNNAFLNLNKFESMVVNLYVKLCISIIVVCLSYVGGDVDSVVVLGFSAA